MFNDLELDFTDSNGDALNTIVLAGINGSGKTSVLQLLQKIFSENSNRFKIGNDLHEFEKERDAIVCDKISIEFESSSAFIQSFKGLISKFKQKASKQGLEIGDISSVLKGINKKLSDASRKSGEKKIFSFDYVVTQKEKNKFNILENNFLPFFLLPEDELSNCFSVLYFVASSFELQTQSKRNSLDIFVKKNQSYETERNGIVQLVDIFSHKKEIEEYLVNSIIDGLLAERNTNIRDGIEFYIKEVNRVLQNIKLSTRLIDITSEKAIFENINNKRVSIDELSSGEKQLYYRAVLLNKLNLKNSLILVDEPETSLHPTWQREIIKLYQNAGENNQIIMATHSPYIISSVKPENIFVLHCDDENSTVKVINMEKEQKYTKGVEPNRILQEIMGYKLRDDETQQQIDEITSHLRQPPEDIKQIEEKIQLLTFNLGTSDPSIMRINHQLFLLKRKLESNQK